MKGDKIPDNNHIARYCKSSQILNGQIQATAFMLRDKEKALSVSWLEFLNQNNRESEIIEMCRIFQEKFSKVGARAVIAVLNVGNTRSKVLIESPDARVLEVIHDPEPDDPSHSSIFNLRHDDELIAELILRTVLEAYNARDGSRVEGGIFP